MIIIVAKNVIKQGMAEEFKNTAKPLIEESRKEDGCISYSLYEDCKNPNVLTFIEKWEDEEAISAHNQSAHFTQIVPKFAKLRESNAEIHLYKELSN